MISLGIDPGTRRIGYGAVRAEGSSVRFISAGILPITATDDLSAFQEIKKGMDSLLQQYSPDVIAVEKLFFSKNQKTAMAVAEARGVILLAAKESGIPTKEYTPNEVKAGVTGYGLSDKKAVLKMVRLILGKPDLSVIDDASDALAIAIVASREPKW